MQPLPLIPASLGGEGRRGSRTTPEIPHKLRSLFQTPEALFRIPKIRTSLIKHWGGWARPVFWLGQDQPLLAPYLSVVGDSILIMEKSVVFSAPCLKPLILAHFRVSEKWLTILFIKRCEKALIYKGFRASPIQSCDILICSKVERSLTRAR